MSAPRAPQGLGSRGRRLWRSVTRDFEPSASELELLTEACRCLDRVEALEQAMQGAPLTVAGSRGQIVAHPLAADLRAERQLLSRLLAQIELPADDDNGGQWDGLSASQRARKAARAKWDKRGRAKK